MLCDRCKERLIEIDHYGERLTGPAARGAVARLLLASGSSCRSLFFLNFAHQPLSEPFTLMLVSVKPPE
jgi:hypothetical protein